MLISRKLKPYTIPLSYHLHWQLSLVTSFTWTNFLIWYVSSPFWGFFYHCRLKPLKVNFLVLFRRVSVCKLLGVLREFLCVMTFRHLHDLCEWGAKEGLSRLRRVFKVTEDQLKKRSSQEDCNLSNYRRETRENFRLRQHSNPGLPDTN